ncbi:DUF4301 family protein [Bizionia paragorgiae]|uniref:DUF4301 domain-containing protein n=1 Tax=Bizionia paragorgiae TaxID=283786 RepID=A0A1H4BGI3_BIZPA|nr:DUF4301 family protein [Bizionia paragorgiae]SEA46912.1 protein of unknown function [Bizionia paragorgiae]
MSFSDKHKQEIIDKGLTLQAVNKQIERFKSGMPFMNLQSAASVGNGILSLSDLEKKKFSEYFSSQKDQLNIVKFVPASGAATRMFKFLFEFLKSYDPKKESINAYSNKNNQNELRLFFVGLEKFPFYNLLLERTRAIYPDFDTLSSDERGVLLVRTLLDEDKLNYSFYPKGVLPFHKYEDSIATAFEEHLYEAALYATTNQVAKLHFTISKAHQAVFEKEFEAIKKAVEEQTQITFKVSFSYQDETTDTIAVTPDNQPFLDAKGSLCFRPSGHGALLSNLNAFEGDLLFIKNIDNVVVSSFVDEVAEYKKILAGVLLEAQQQAFSYLEELENELISEERVIEVARFLQRKLNVIISPEFEKYSLKYQIEYLETKLNRPIRVCGMVKNEGEPGGGPFWVKDEGGHLSLQIVESAQIDTENKQQLSILKNATHFNPVDIVLGIKNYKGETFDLSKFVDHNAAFITAKTHLGKPLKALELPGLWNGSMAHWNTIFVEVPTDTFNPVKTVNDLLKTKHQVV